MFGAWIGEGDALAESFRTASPFPLIVLDGFLDHAVAEELLAEFPLPARMPKSRDYVFGDKHELSSVADQGPASRGFRDAMLGPVFQEFICALTGKRLFVDPAFHGGGFHQSGDGGYLDTHVDFNLHPLNRDWLRTLNVLLYLNKDWRPEYDGRLLVKSAPDEEPRAIAPLFNRGVIMLSSDHTYHGFRRMTLPAGVTRKSIAAYAYEQVDAGAVKARTTGWAPDGANAAKRMIARHYDVAVRVKNRVLGSGTAKNR